MEGNFYDGCSAIVYYYNYPSNDNIYSAEIYGDMGLIVPDDWDYGDQGGWAGSHYYDSMPATNLTGNAVDTNVGTMVTHEGYNSDGSTYEAFWCPNCGAEVSLAMESCPNCGLGF